MLAVAGVMLAGCGTPGGGDQGQPTSDGSGSNPLASFDPCTALTPEEIRSFGGDPNGEPASGSSKEEGCDYEGEKFMFGVLKGMDSDEAYWERRKNSFDVFTPNQVGSHKGFTGIALSGKGQGVCRQMMYVGSGSVIVDVTYSSNTIPSSDEETCAQATEIAQVVEKKLPQ
ncbi:DUF3558 domain-containing protein [Saccharopolyspora sp. NPDC000359]|uniref:DUF3558 domain-containing protein n=1 Tax=Saccharopolyspora sp. NPDC000359 TaxID=3154251 RepID=UPI0033297053